MANPHQILGTAVIVPTGGLSLSWSAVAVDSLSATQAISGSATLTAGTYSPWGFVNHVAKQLRASLFAVINATAWFSTKPASVAALPVQMGLPAAGPTDGVGQTLLRLKCASTGGALHTGLATSWQSFSLVNTNNNWCWAGMAYPGETRALSISAGGFDDTGRFQPRWLFVLRSSFQDSGDDHAWSKFMSHQLGNNKVAQFTLTNPQRSRVLSIRTQPQHIAGPSWLVGTFSTFGATRNLLALLSMDETLFTGVSNTYKRTDNLAAPAYLKCGDWWARYRDESPTDTYRLCDVWPTSISPASGEPVEAISEAQALFLEWQRVGLLFRYEPIDETGLSSNIAKAYAPRADSGGLAYRPQRVSQGNLFYSVDFPLLLNSNPALAVP